MKNRLHILVDSRETSVSFARQFFRDHTNKNLATVKHIRGVEFAQHLENLLEKCCDNYELLLSVRYLPDIELEAATYILHKYQGKYKKIYMATYPCFLLMIEWAEKNCIDFLPNTMKQRKKPPEIKDNFTEKENDCLYRIWVQYRLMLAIISRIEKLSKICRQLIGGEPAEGETLEQEFIRAMQYFEQGEPDMAGGSYAEEKSYSNPIDELRSRINKIAATDFNVLLSGNSGTGKETVAWSIHELSSRRNAPFMALNCAGLPDELLESEMFGYIKGSHSQADTDSKGILETVDGGTLFLDELPEMSQRIQAKLLRFVESGEYRPFGSSENRYADVRIIAAGQPERLKTGTVRPDLKNRIGQLYIDILSLQELEKCCTGTLYKIAFILFERYTWTTIFKNNKVHELTPCDIIKYQDKLSSPETLDILVKQKWEESNIRELNNFLRRWIVFGDEELKMFDYDNNTSAEDTQINFYDKYLEAFLYEPKNRKELEQIAAYNPLGKIKKSYIKHLYLIYSTIVEKENNSQTIPRRPTQKEFAKIFGATENTISKYLN